MYFVVVDPRLLVRALEDPDGRPAKLLSLLLYGWVCANARGLGLDEVNVAEADLGGSAADAAHVAGLRSRAERAQFDAQLRKALVEDALGDNARDDLALVTSKPLRAELLRLAPEAGIPAATASRLIARCTVALSSLDPAPSEEGQSERSYLIRTAAAAKAALVTDDPGLQDASQDVRVYSLNGFVAFITTSGFRFDDVDAPAAQRAALRPLAGIVEELLPEELVFATLVREAVSSPEIVAGAEDLGIRIELLDAEVSEPRAVAGVRQEIVELVALDNRLTTARAALDVAPAITALEAERDFARQRLRTALMEEILRQLRAAVDREAAADYSTLLRVGEAPGLAHLVDDGYGVHTRAHQQLEALFGRMAGGSIGLAGRRGVGKSHQIEHFCAPAEPGKEPRVLTTVVSAPTQYDSREFLLHLLARLCETVVGGANVRDQILLEQEGAAAGPFSRSRREWAAVAAIAAAVGGLLLIAGALLNVAADALLVAGTACLIGASTAVMTRSSTSALISSTMGAVLVILGGLLIAGSTLDLWVYDRLDAGAIALALAIALGMTARLSRSAPRADARTPHVSFPDPLVSTARARLDEVHYQKTLATAWSSKATGKVTAGAVALGGEAGLTGTRTLATTALTFPEIVARVQAFLKQATASELGSGAKLTVRIGIDELDKMESEEVAHRFLNEIKAVFGIAGCFFLVSVSEEALSNFDRRGAQLRDVFDSSFDEIVYVQPLSFSEARDLLAQRVIRLPIPYHGLCYVLSGGLPRDLIRVARAVVAAKPADSDGRLSDIVAMLIAGERDQRVRALSVAARDCPGEPHASAFLSWMAAVQLVAMSASALLAVCQDAALLAVVDGPSGGSTQHGLNDFVIELVTFCYFAATVLEVFGDTMTKEAMGSADSPASEWSSLEELMEARVAAASNPHVGWALITRFRSRRSMVVLDLPRPPRPPRR